MLQHIRSVALHIELGTSYLLQAVDVFIVFLLGKGYLLLCPRLRQSMANCSPSFLGSIHLAASQVEEHSSSTCEAVRGMLALTSSNTIVTIWQEKPQLKLRSHWSMHRFACSLMEPFSGAVDVVVKPRQCHGPQPLTTSVAEPKRPWLIASTFQVPKSSRPQDVLRWCSLRDFWASASSTEEKAASCVGTTVLLKQGATVHDNFTKKANHPTRSDKFIILFRTQFMQRCSVSRSRSASGFRHQDAHCSFCVAVLLTLTATTWVSASPKLLCTARPCRIFGGRHQNNQLKHHVLWYPMFTWSPLKAPPISNLCACGHCSHWDLWDSLLVNSAPVLPPKETFSARDEFSMVPGGKTAPGRLSFLGPVAGQHKDLWYQRRPVENGVVTNTDIREKLVRNVNHHFWYFWYVTGLTRTKAWICPRWTFPRDRKPRKPCGLGDDWRGELQRRLREPLSVYIDP